MSRFVFPYGIRFQEDGRIEVFPAAELFVLGHKGEGVRTLFHVDSGATTSVMPADDARILGLKIRSGKRTMVRGFTGEPLAGYEQHILVEFQKLKIKIPVVFVEHGSIPRILGRDGVFPHFGIFFDEANRRTVFLENVTERERIEKLID